ncbi:hypothetical protein OG500_00585 [Kitasatospora sp. NBC_01250]|uniref:hypothetical protein n=1 Tax=unclassified Kitasatospora TaxID=2633591 RepID=UPI002E0DFE34|nr:MULTISPECIES: hypothetical protein [unclassified Kitasatospora]WSJ64695.1 hypothetical protein OG294_00490 [Kitasatospora sp. NBC_01302]
MTTDETTAPAVGAHGQDEVFEAIKGVSRRPSPCTGFEHGVLASYQWATGAQPEAPLTAVPSPGTLGPCRHQLLAECRSAAVKLRTALRDGTDAGYVLGSYQALAWLCGLHDDRP